MMYTFTLCLQCINSVFDGARFIMQPINIQQDIWLDRMLKLLTHNIVLSSDRETLDLMVLLEEMVLLESK